jgi:hypothetical protein
MALQVFNFPMHKVSVEYPARGKAVTLGNNWDYTVKSHTPVAKKFTLTFAGMKFFEPTKILTAFQKRYSLQALEDFYLAHELHDSFLFEHERYGSVVVKFMQPLVIPEGLTGADGVHTGIQVSLKQVSVS